MGEPYLDATTKHGKLRKNRSLLIEQMYGMIWYLADGDAYDVAMALRNYQTGLTMSPGVKK